MIRRSAGRTRPFQGAPGHPPKPYFRYGLRLPAFLALTGLGYLDAVKVGRLVLEPQVQLGLSYNDNIAYSDADQREDFIGTARASLSGTYPLTRYNTLEFRAGVSYDHYFNNPDLSTSDISYLLLPESRLSLDLRVSEHITLKLYDNLKFATDPVGVVGVDADNNEIFYNPLRFARVDNTLGATASWEVNSRNTFQFGIHRQDIIPLDDDFDNVDRTTHTLWGDWAHQWNSKWMFGLNGSIFTTDWQENFQNDSWGWRLGPYVRYQYSEYLRFSGGISYNYEEFDRDGLNQDASDTDAWSGTVAVEHTLNAVYSHALSYSRTISYGYVTNTTTFDRLVYSFTYTGLRLCDVAGSLGLEYGQDSGETIYSELYTLGYGSLGLNFPIGRGDSVSVEYRHSQKLSDNNLRDYVQNYFGVVLTITF